MNNLSVSTSRSKITVTVELDITHAHIVLESLRQEIARINSLPAVEAEFMRGYIESAKQAIVLIERAAKAKMEQ